MCHQLVRLHGGAVETERMVDILRHAKRHRGVGAVDRRGRSIEQMASVGMPAPLEHIEEANDIGIDLVVRRLERVADAGLGREMHNAGEFAFGEQRRDAVTILEIEFAEAEILEAGKFSKPRLLERGIIIGIDVIDADDGVALFDETPSDVKSNESCGAGDEDRLNRHRISRKP
jgi:hypothetical protein